MEEMVKQFGGLRNDEDSKQIEPQYFFRLKNFNFPVTGTLGIETILYPDRVRQIDSFPIDGLETYRFKDDNNLLQTQYVAVSGGNIWVSNSEDFTFKTKVKTGLTPGKVSMITFNDRFYIANGKNYVNIYDGVLVAVKEMGAPFATPQPVSGNPYGPQGYYYALTYVTAGGEEVIGSISNVCYPISQKVLLDLPLGYAGTTTKKIYRTANGGGTLLFLASVSNTTISYTDDSSDSSLGIAIPPINNGLSKPYFLESANQILFGAKVDIYPTQLFLTGTNEEIFDTANSLDVTNYGTDNTAINGMGADFAKLVIGSGLNIIFVDPSDLSVTFTRANVGVYDGYSMKRVPAFGDFPGGLMFVSTELDVRVINGLQALPVSTSLDNIRTENWSQAIRGTLPGDLIGAKGQIYAEYFDYRYHLLTGRVRYVFDTRLQKWTYHDIQTENFKDNATVMAILNGNFYNGQQDGWLEKEYIWRTYRDENVIATIESPEIQVAKEYKFMNKFIYWFIGSRNGTAKFKCVTDNNPAFSENVDFHMTGGVFDPNIFNPNFFLTDQYGLDYRVFNINRMVRWYKYSIMVTEGAFNLQGFGFEAQGLENK
jgi:hypothetical protein